MPQEVLDHLTETREPMLITRNGESRAMLHVNIAWRAQRIQPECGCSKRSGDRFRKRNSNRRRGRQAVHALLAIQGAGGC